MTEKELKERGIKTGVIYRIHPDELEILKEISIKVNKIKKGNITPIGFFRYLMINVPTGKTIALASFDDKGGIESCMTLTIHLDDMLKKFLWIDFAWKNPKTETKLADSYTEHVDYIARQNGIKIIRTEMQRGYKAAIKKYGFEYRSTILEREVKIEEEKKEKEKVSVQKEGD